MRIFYSSTYTIAAHSFETTRKSRWIAESLVREPISGIELVAPEPTSVPALSRVHDPEYVDAVRNGKPRELAESQGFHWDPGLWEMVCASNGGVMAAAIDALGSRGVSGSLSSGLHHARRARGAGFRTCNGGSSRSTGLLSKRRAHEGVVIGRVRRGGPAFRNNAWLAGCKVWSCPVNAVQPNGPASQVRIW
jgi:acetoin utilization deacetylase AcuC-like enzyme